MENKSIEIDTYLKELNHPLKDLVAKVRAIILQANEEITEHIKWGAPSFAYKGEDRVTFNLRAREGIQLVFHRGAKAKNSRNFKYVDDTGLLDWITTDRANIKFDDMTDITSKKQGLMKVVNDWIKRAE